MFEFLSQIGAPRASDLTRGDSNPEVWIISGSAYHGMQPTRARVLAAEHEADRAGGKVPAKETANEFGPYPPVSLGEVLSPEALANNVAFWNKRLKQGVA